MGPGVAATWLFMVIYYFFTLYSKVRWFPCVTWCSASFFIVMMVWGCTTGFIFFSFCLLLSKLFISKCGSCCFGYFVLTCYMEPSWFPFSDF